MPSCSHNPAGAPTRPQDAAQEQANLGHSQASTSMLETDGIKGRGAIHLVHGATDLKGIPSPGQGAGK